MLALKWSEVDLVTRTARLDGHEDRRFAAAFVARGLRRAALASTLRRACVPGLCRGRQDDARVPQGLASHRQAKAGFASDVTPHVLRHSFASVADDLGYSELTIAALIGHKKASVTSKYAHNADAVLLQAADAVADRVAELMGEARHLGVVVELPRRA